MLVVLELLGKWLYLHTFLLLSSVHISCLHVIIDLTCLRTCIWYSPKTSECSGELRNIKRGKNSV